MFVTPSDDYNYYGETFLAPSGKNIVFPTELDTEFAHPKFDINNPIGVICKNLTIQCRSIYHKKGLIYAHKDMKDARHEISKSGFTAVDYLTSHGYDCHLYRLPSWTTKTDVLPWIQIDIYAFFAVAELMRIFSDEYRTDVLSLVTNPTTYGIEQGRRLRAFTKAGNKLFNWVEMPWILAINGIAHRVRIRIYDTCAVHGVANYASFCANSGITLSYKDNFNSNEKAAMDDMYTNRPQEYDDYALGDLFNYEALLGNQKNFAEIYNKLGLTEYFTPPKLTIGATVARMLESAVKKLFNSDINAKNDVINKFCRFGSADNLKRYTQTTACLNAKVDGGRCRNNRPVETIVKGLICDIDISSCYGEGLRVQTYPLGVPLIIDYPIDSKLNDYQTLREFLKKYKKELAPGLWQARVSLKDGYILQCPQDYFVSWFPPADMSNLRTDEDFVSTDEWWTVDNFGETKILNHEIHHAIFTHSDLQWLDNVASQKQKKELLDNLIIETAMIYPASMRVNTPEELVEKHKLHKGVNICDGVIDKKKVQKISISEDCHHWYGLNLGELIVNRLLLQRKKHPKKTSFNELYKLCVNTVYGDMVSPFFKVGNVVVGNNITSRVRSLAWCMEKGFQGFQTITDGCTFDVNKVLFPRDNRRITGEMTTNLYRDKKQLNYKLAPLLDIEYLSVTDNCATLELADIDGKPAIKLSGNDNVTLSPEDALSWINLAAWKHLQNLFPGLDILHEETTNIHGVKRLGQFEFEAKGFYDTLITHGSANYILGYRDKFITKMRSYSKREQSVVTLEDELLIEQEGEKLATIFLKKLACSESVERSEVYLKEKILKCGDFRKNFRKYEGTEVYPGISIKNAGLVREFSLSQFTFRTYKQLLSWRREYERLLRGYNQSYEMFFINEDDTLNYRLMVETIDHKIRNGDNSFFEGCNRLQADTFRKKMICHPQTEALNRTRNQLDIHYLHHVTA